MINSKYGDQIRSLNTRDDLSHDEKRVRKSKIKADAYQSIRSQAINSPWQKDNVTINITLIKIDEHKRIIVWCEAWRDGEKLKLDLPFIYVNPPLVHNGEESPLAVLQEMVMQTVRGG